MSDKKDVLEFPLEELEVPQAIVVMMQAAATCGKAWCDEQENAGWAPDLDRLQLLCEKLEARVEDAVEAAKVPVEVPDDVDNTFSNVDGHDVSLQTERVEHRDTQEAVEVITKVVVDRGVYGLLCNEPVMTHPVSGERTPCIKEFRHQSLEHEDKDGAIR